MSYEADLAQVAESLAQLLATGDPPRSDELPAVNAARLGLRRLCAQVLGDVAPVLPVRVGDGRPGIADLARSPVSTLRGLLAKDPPELIAAEGDRPANDGGAPSAWRTLWAATALAADDWSRADLASRPTGAEAWSAVADIVAVAEAAALVDRDLVDPRRGRFRVRRSDDSWRVGIAAAEVRRLACTGSLPPAEPLRPDGKNLLPLRVRSLAELPAALTRLAHLVRVAGHLRPESVGALAGAHARTLALMAKVMEGGIASGGTHGVMPGLSDALRTHAVALVNVRGAVRRVRSISSDDPRPARQMAQVRTTLLALGDRLSSRGAEPARRALAEAARPALTFGPAMRDLVEWQVSFGQWYTREEGHGRFEWTPTGPGSEPRAVDSVRIAASDAARLLTRVPPPESPASQVGGSARGVLDPLLLGRYRRRHSSPADEPGAARIPRV
jgi:hypothetical protein